jgi:hypothetical protein
LGQHQVSHIGFPDLGEQLVLVHSRLLVGGNSCESPWSEFWISSLKT